MDYTTWAERKQLYDFFLPKSKPLEKIPNNKTYLIVSNNGFFASSQHFMKHNIVRVINLGHKFVLRLSKYYRKTWITF